MTEAVTETSPLIRSANQRTGFYMITASVMKELKVTVGNLYTRFEVIFDT